MERKRVSFFWPCIMAIVAAIVFLVLGSAVLALVGAAKIVWIVYLSAGSISVIRLSYEAVSEALDDAESDKGRETK